jgi:hypothetical protein
MPNATHFAASDRIHAQGDLALKNVSRFEITQKPEATSQDDERYRVNALATPGSKELTL